MEKGKRIQEHNNRAALTNVPGKASLKEKLPDRPYQVGRRFRKRNFLSNSRLISTPGVKVSGYKEDKNTTF